MELATSRHTSGLMQSRAIPARTAGTPEQREELECKQLAPARLRGGYGAHRSGLREESVLSSYPSHSASPSQDSSQGVGGGQSSWGTGTTKET